MKASPTAIEEYFKNLDTSMLVVKKFQQDHLLTDKQMDYVVETLLYTIENGANGIISNEALEMALNYIQLKTK